MPNTAGAVDLRPVLEQALLAGNVGVIDPHIDSHAQFTLLEMFKTGGETGGEAALILAAVKTQRLGGIYIQDQGVPALRAKAMGTVWWELIPKHLDAVVLPAPPSEPNGKPILVMRKSTVGDAAKRKAGLRDAFSAFMLAEAGLIAADNCGSGTAVSQFAGPERCLVDMGLPTGLPAPKTLVQNGAQVWPRLHSDFGNKPICARLFQDYQTCLAYIGVKVKPNVKRNFLPEPKAASEWSNKQTVHTGSLSLAQLHTIVEPAPLLDSEIPQGETQRLNLGKFLGPMNEAFRVAGLDTVESRAHFLAHYAGELGGAPSFFHLEEQLAPKGKHRCAVPDTFIGRGPLQPTCRKVYLLTLVYAEFMARERLAEADTRLVAAKLEADKAVQNGTFDVSTSTKLWTEVEQILQLLEDGKRLYLMADAVAANPRLASEFEHGVLFSAVYWHAATCGKNLAALAGRKGNTTEDNFIGAAFGSVCVSGGAATDSSKGRARVKSRVYNCGVRTMQGKACAGASSPASLGAGAPSAGKGRAKTVPRAKQAPRTKAKAKTRAKTKTRKSSKRAKPTRR